MARTSQNFNNPKIIEIITELDHLSDINLLNYGIDRIDSGLCALGSTIKKAGSQQAFKNIDYTLVLRVAEFAKRFGAEEFSVISALGADRNSGIFYNKVKGEMEEGLKALNFKLLTIIRPSLLLGERKEKRVAEKIFIKLSPLLNKTLFGPLKKYRGIEAHKVATILAQSIKSQDCGVTVIENSQMLDI